MVNDNNNFDRSKFISMGKFVFCDGSIFMLFRKFNDKKV